MLLQFLYQIFAAYFTDDCADHLRKDPLFTRLVDKDVLASQPTLSRFWNRMDDSTLGQFLSILKKMRKAVYSVSMPREVILDLDSTLLTAYGQQEGRRFNFHYQDSGYHPLLCYDGHTLDLIQIQLRTGNVFSSDGTVDFLQPVLNDTAQNIRTSGSNSEVTAVLPSPPFMTRLKITIFPMRSG